jgi:hypothetical protein
MRYVILAVGQEDNDIAIAVPPSYSYHQAQDTRDVLEDMGYETRGLLELVTLTEARKRAKS